MSLVGGPRFDVLDFNAARMRQKRRNDFYSLIFKVSNKFGALMVQVKIAVKLIIKKSS
jgi:hypothetical protein